MEKMKVTDRLLAATAEIWDGYYTHPFVEGLRDGTLDKEKFRYYIMQDYLAMYYADNSISEAKMFGNNKAKS